MKEAFLTDLAVPNSNNLHITLTKKLQKYKTWNMSLLECDKWK